MSGPAPLGNEPVAPTPGPYARFIVARLGYDAALLGLFSAGLTVEEMQREHEETCRLMRKLAHVMGYGEAP